MTLLTQIGNVTYAEPIDGFADIVALVDGNGNNVLAPDMLREGNALARAIYMYRLEHARQTNYHQYLKLCAARGIAPDPPSPPPSNFTGSFKDWPID